MGLSVLSRAFECIVVACVENSVPSSSLCIPNRSYIKERHPDFGTLVDNLLKHGQLALRANQSCELNETLHTYDSIVAQLSTYLCLLDQ